MARPHAVTNTTPIIALAGIDQLRLLDALFERVVVPIEVWAELIDLPGAPEPDALRALECVVFMPTADIPVEATGLDDGEAAAIALAIAYPGALVLMDEAAGRKVAMALGLPVRGSLGVLVEAKRQGLLPLVRPLIEHMQANGVRLAPQLVVAVLQSVGEL